MLWIFSCLFSASLLLTQTFSYHSPAPVTMYSRRGLFAFHASLRVLPPPPTPLPAPFSQKEPPQLWPLSFPPDCFGKCLSKVSLSTQLGLLKSTHFFSSQQAVFKSAIFPTSTSVAATPGLLSSFSFVVLPLQPLATLFALCKFGFLSFCLTFNDNITALPLHQDFTKLEFYAQW